MASKATDDSKPPSREIEPIIQPIPTLSSPTSRTFIHVHPILLTAYFYLRFSSLVADPVSALTTDIFPVAAIQCAYAAICLPVSKRSSTSEAASSTSSTSTSSSTRSKTSTKQRGHRSAPSPNDATPATRVTNAILSLLLTAVASAPLYLFLVLFGAPLTTHFPHTFLTAIHFSLIAAFPLFYAHGVDRRTWWEIGGAMLPFDGVWGATVGTALGAWLGAVPIPLDWDREWQKWPVTIVTGMYMGAVIGEMGGRWLFHGKRMQFTPGVVGK